METTIDNSGFAGCLLSVSKQVLRAAFGVGPGLTRVNFQDSIACWLV